MILIAIYAAILEFTDFSTLDERLNGRKFLAIDFHGAINGWAKAQFIEYERTRDGKLAKVLFVTQIIEEEKRKEEELIKKSTIDELTGLLNRRAYEEAIRDLKSNENLSYVICSLDVNGLKVVNDDIGHSAGDELLRGAAEVLSRCLVAYGKVFRIGGDEFAVLVLHADVHVGDVLAVGGDADKTAGGVVGVDGRKHRAAEAAALLADNLPEHVLVAFHEARRVGRSALHGTRPARSIGKDAVGAELGRDRRAGDGEKVTAG